MQSWFRHTPAVSCLYSNGKRWFEQQKDRNGALLPNAKPTEHAIEQIVGVDRADDRPKFLQRQPQLQRQQLGQPLVEDDGMRLSQMPQARIDVVPASTETWRQRRWSPAAYRLRRQRPQLVQPFARPGAGGKDAARRGLHVAFRRNRQHILRGETRFLIRFL